MRSLEASWKPLEVTEARSLAGSKLERQKDGSWLASGENPATDSYVIEVRAARPESLTAIRIEALPDPSLPGAGRAATFMATFR